MADNGLKRYSVQEANNVTLGQLGFDELAASTIYPGVTTKTGPWIAIKIVNNTCTVSATSTIGDNLSSVALEAGDILYGAFSAITTGSFVDTGLVIAYRG